MSANQSHYVIALDWSESPHHHGRYRIYLQFHEKSSRWTLRAAPSLGTGRLSWTSGQGMEEPRAIAVQLLVASQKRGCLPFDAIGDSGPFDIALNEIVQVSSRPKEGAIRINSIGRTCENCRFLVRPQGVAAAIGRLYQCQKGQWSDEVRAAARSMSNGIGSGAFRHTCHLFSASDS